LNCVINSLFERHSSPKEKRRREEKNTHELIYVHVNAKQLHREETKKKKKNVKKGEKKNQKKTQRETGKRDGGGGG